MSENVIAEFSQSLQTTENPHTILAALYRELFNKPLQQNEWGILRKYIRLYGRWIVYEALIRTATSPNIDLSKPVWAYVNSVALSLLDAENKKKQVALSKERDKERTAELIASLRAVDTSLVKLVSEEEL